MAHLLTVFLFVMVEFKKVLYSPDLKKWYSFFLLRKSSNVQMSKCLTLMWYAMSRNGGLSVCNHPLPQENWPTSKIAFADSCSI